MKLLRILLLLCTLLSTGCGAMVENSTSSGYTVKDVRGKTVTIAKAPKKILTDSLHLDETLLCVVPADHLAGAYYLDDEPGISFIAAETKTITPKLRQYTPEAVAKLHPDLFLASQWSDPGLIQKVEEMGIPVVVCYGPVTVQQIEDNVKLMGKAVDNPQAGEKSAALMEKRLEKIDSTIKQQPGPKPVGLLVSLMSRYGGKGSLYDELASRAGFINGIAAAGIKNGDTLTPEAVLAVNPDFFLISKPYGEEETAYHKFADQFFANPVFAGLKGLQHRVALPDRYVYNASPMAVYGVEAMANGAYGREIFPKADENILKGY